MRRERYSDYRRRNASEPKIESVAAGAKRTDAHSSRHERSENRSGHLRPVAAFGCCRDGASRKPKVLIDQRDRRTRYRTKSMEIDGLDPLGDLERRLESRHSDQRNQIAIPEKGAGKILASMKNSRIFDLHDALPIAENVAAR